MKYGHVAGIDRPVARMVMGSMFYSLQNIDLCCSMLDDYVSLGGNCIDTAAIYYGGESEKAVGEWMRQREVRDQIILIAKGAHHDAHGPRVNPTEIERDLTHSLERLQTDYADVYILHRDDPGYPVGEIVECLNEHLRAGRIRAFGGSNWTVERLQAANDYAREHRLVGFAASSPNFSLAIPNVPRWPGCVSVSSSDRDWYTREQFPLFAWSSQASGFFSGKFREDAPDNPEMTRVWYSKDNFDRLRRANELAVKRGVTAIEVAFAYVLCQPFPTFALVGPHSIEETHSTASGLELDLAPQEVAWLNLEA